MPDVALPQPRPGSLSGKGHVRLEYRDPLGRPMTGKVTFTPVGSEPIREGALTVPMVPVTVTVENGAAEADLPPGAYTVVADLRTADGQRTTVQGEVNL